MQLPCQTPWAAYYKSPYRERSGPAHSHACRGLCRPDRSGYGPKDFTGVIAQFARCGMQSLW